MTRQDEMMTRIGEAIALMHQGERVEARERFQRIWDEMPSGEGDPFHRCVLAHYMADLRDDPREELAWDLLALDAADELTDERVQAHHESLRISGFRPSLHLNLAEDYRG